jgi:hypothetical protein
MSSSNSLSRWETYPASVDLHMLVDQSIETYRRRLVEDSPRLFAADHDSLVSLRVSINQQGQISNICPLSSY